MSYARSYKFFISSLILFATVYTLYALKGMKDTLIITELGAELISTLKLYGVLPFSFLFTLLYARLTDYFTRIQIYHLLNWSFILFFIIFSVFLYPHSQELHLDLTKSIKHFPALKYPLLMIAYWSYSLFYILSELWGSVMLSLMFWQLANQIYSVDEAKKTYPLFGLLAELGVLLSGIILSLVSCPTLAPSWDVSLQYVCISIVIAGICISLSIQFLSNNTGKETINGPNTRSKSKFSFIQRMHYILSSKHIALLTFILICYGATLNFVEAVWRKQISLYYPNSLDCSYFMGKMQIAMSIAIILLTLISFFTLPRMRWRSNALIIPIITVTTGTFFFMLTIYGEALAKLENLLGYDILFLSVLLGATQSILIKASKYAFFDPIKEIVFIPLNEELKSKGKSVADVMGEHLGKAGSSLMEWSLLSFIAGSTLISIAPYIFALFLSATLVWIILVFKLDKIIKKVS